MENMFLSICTKTALPPCTMKQHRLNNTHDTASTSVSRKIIVAFGQNHMIRVQHHHIHQHHSSALSVEHPPHVLATAPKCFKTHKASLISRNNSMTPAAQMSQRNRHDCVAAAGVRLRQFSSAASYLVLLGREGEHRVKKTAQFKIFCSLR